MTPKQANNLQPMTNHQLNLISQYPDDAEAVLNQIFKDPTTKSDRRWYPTPETCDDPSNFNKIEKRIYDEIVKLRAEEKLDPTASDEQRHEFLANFQWEQSILSLHEKQKIEALLGKYHDIFARHRLDIGINTEFKIKLTPKHDEPVYAQSLPTPTNLKDDLLVELALMQEYGIITTLPYSKYSSPIFAQRKPNAKLRILVDLRRINHLLKNDYNQHNHPVTTMADAAQHMAGKRYFCKLDCSQAYHCLQMADEQSVQLLAFNFGSRTFAYLRLAHRLNRSLSAFNSTVREYLDPLVKADKCAQYVDDIGIAANNVEELVDNIEAVFMKIKQAGLKLSMAKCAFGHPEIEFLGRSITSKGVAPIEEKIDKFLKNIKLPTSVKSLQRYIGFVQFYRQSIPCLAEKLVPLYKLLQKDAKFELTQVHKDAMFDINENLANAAKMSLRLPLPDKQLVIMCDASEHAAGYVLLIEDYTETNDGPTKSYAPVAFGSQRFTEGQMSLTMYAKEFLAMHFAFDEFDHILWGVKKPTIVMTDNKASQDSSSLNEYLLNCGTTATKHSNSTSSWPMYLESRTQQLTTCPESTSTQRTGSTSSYTTRYQSSRSKLTWHQKHPNRTMRKTITFQTRRMCLMLQHHQIQRCSHSWRCSLNGVTKTTNSTVDALMTSKPRCNHL